MITLAKTINFNNIILERVIKIMYLWDVEKKSNFFSN